MIDTQVGRAATSTASICAGIMAHGRHRRAYMKLRTRIRNQMCAYARVQMGWTKEDKQEKRIAASARFFVSTMLREKAERPANLMEPSAEARRYIAAWVQTCRLSYDAARKEEQHYAAKCEKMAKHLPVAKWLQANIPGFGLGNLGTIIGEAGNLSDYSNPAKLWKRMGLAVVGGIAQGKLDNGASADDWIEHGYNRQRRSTMYVVFDTVRRKQGQENSTNRVYYDLYLQRLEYEKPRVKTEPHAKARARRYVEKRMLRDLWRAWRDCEAASQE